MQMGHNLRTKKMKFLSKVFDGHESPKQCQYTLALRVSVMVLEPWT